MFRWINEKIAEMVSDTVAIISAVATDTFNATKFTFYFLKNGLISPDFYKWLKEYGLNLWQGLAPSIDPHIVTALGKTEDTFSSFRGSFYNNIIDYAGTVALCELFSASLAAGLQNEDEPETRSVYLFTQSLYWLLRVYYLRLGAYQFWNNIGYGIITKKSLSNTDLIKSREYKDICPHGQKKKTLGAITSVIYNESDVKQAQLVGFVPGIGPALKNILLPLAYARSCLRAKLHSSGACIDDAKKTVRINLTYSTGLGISFAISLWVTKYVLAWIMDTLLKKLINREHELDVEAIFFDNIFIEDAISNFIVLFFTTAMLLTDKPLPIKDENNLIDPFFPGRWLAEHIAKDTASAIIRSVKNPQERGQIFQAVQASFASPPVHLTARFFLREDIRDVKKALTHFIKRPAIYAAFDIHREDIRGGLKFVGTVRYHRKLVRLAEFFLSADANQILTFMLRKELDTIYPWLKNLVVALQPPGSDVISEIVYENTDEIAKMIAEVDPKLGAAIVPQLTVSAVAVDKLSRYIQKDYAPSVASDDGEKELIEQKTEATEEDGILVVWDDSPPPVKKSPLREASVFQDVPATPAPVIEAIVEGKPQQLFM